MSLLITSVALLARVVGRLVRLTPNGGRTFFSPDEFPWSRLLEQEWGVIRAELDRLLGRVERVPNFQDISPDQAALTQDDRWKTFWFRGYGRDVPRNRNRCPRTSRLLEGIPGLTTAMFSILRGPKSIAPHAGAYAGVLRLHLALRVPSGEGESWIRVGSKKASWEEGRCLIFDDTHEHEVRHDVAGDRVVLFVDFLRPLPWPLNALNRAVVALIAHTQPFVVAGFENHAAWEARHGHAFDLTQ